MATYHTRVRELLTIFAGREEIADLGQFAACDRTRIAWAVTRGLIISEKRPWPGPLVGTCIKTWYVRVGC